MMALSDAQLDILENRLKNAGISPGPLYHDLLDHLYCLTLEGMNQGLDFSHALQQAEAGMGELKAIEHDVFFFLTFSFQIRMNRLLYSGAFLAAFGQTAYVLFRTLRWPGADGMLLLAIGAVLFLVLPVLFFQYQSGQGQWAFSKKVRFLSGCTGLGFFALGSAFKIFYLPAANVQILLGTVLLALLFFPLYFWDSYQQARNQIVQPA
jgi:hypothetical protein